MSVKDKIYDFIVNAGQADTKMLQSLFDISRQMINRYLQLLVKEGKIIKTGRTKGAFYRVKNDDDNHIEQFSKIYETHMPTDIITGDFLSKANIRKQCNKNCFEIIQFVLYQLIDNVQRHTKSPFVQIELESDPLDMELTVIDSGMGLLQSIKDKYQMKNEVEALFQINLPFSGFDFSDNEIIAEHLMTMIMISDQFTLQTHNSLMEKWDEQGNNVFECEFYKGTRIRFLLPKNTKKKLKKFTIEQY